MSNEELLENIKQMNYISIRPADDILLNHPQFTQVVKPLYAWIKKLEILQKPVNVEICTYETLQDTDLVILMIPNNNTLIPSTIKNIILQMWTSEKHTCTLQDIRSIYNLEDSISSLIYSMQIGTVTILNDSYLEMEKTCLNSTNNIINKMEQFNEISCKTIKDIFTYEASVPRNCIFSASDIIELHLKYLKQPLEDNKQTLKTIRNIEEKIINELMDITDNGLKYIGKDLKEYALYKNISLLKSFIEFTIEYMQKITIDKSDSYNSMENLGDYINTHIENKKESANEKQRKIGKLSKYRYSINNGK